MDIKTPEKRTLARQSFSLGPNSNQPVTMLSSNILFLAFILFIIFPYSSFAILIDGIFRNFNSSHYYVGDAEWSVSDEESVGITFSLVKRGSPSNLEARVSIMPFREDKYGRRRGEDIIVSGLLSLVHRTDATKNIDRSFKLDVRGAKPLTTYHTPQLISILPVSDILNQHNGFWNRKLDTITVQLRAYFIRK